MQIKQENLTKPDDIKAIDSTQELNDVKLQTKEICFPLSQNKKYDPGEIIYKFRTTEQYSLIGISIFSEITNFTFDLSVTKAGTRDVDRNSFRLAGLYQFIDVNVLLAPSCDIEVRMVNGVITGVADRILFTLYFTKKRRR